MANAETPKNDQGSFFDVETQRSGVTDPSFHEETETLIPNPEGSYPSGEAPAAERPIDPRHQIDEEALTAANATQRRHNAQSGSHSPLQRDGTYLTVRPGDVLPGFGKAGQPGIVTRTNFDAAKLHAQRLEADRTRQK